MLNNVLIPFFRLEAQHATLKREIRVAIERVIASDQFILGREVEAFEKEFAAYIGTRFAVGVASGTDALALALMALDVVAGDEVITVANTAAPTAVAICQAGATPVFVDIEEEGFHLDPARIEQAITPRTKAILPVHLFGQPADMDSICALANKHGIAVIEDACQAHGALYKSKKAGCLGLMGCFSFYPTKNLGCLGDGGMITLNDEDLYEQLLLLRNYGQKSKYEHVVLGINSRLDELQAAVLRVKLKYLDAWNRKRKDLAGYYSKNITNPLVKTPEFDEDRVSAHHLYVVEAQARDALQAWLKQHGIGSLIHYPGPLHRQPAFGFLNYQAGDLPRTENRARTILSLPLYPELPVEDVDKVSQTINKFNGRS